MHRLLLVLLAAASALVMSSCGSLDPAPSGSATADGKPANPYPPGSYDHFKAEPNYRKTYNVWRDDEVLSRTDASNSRLIISLKDQRGILMNGSEVAMDYPVSTGRKSHPTPAGSYTVLEMKKEKRSNVYGKIYDADGNVVNSDADARKDEIPEGGKFVGASMPYWIRLTWSGIGLHIGQVPRYPASHACIRVPRSVMPLVYSKVKLGTPVTIK